MDTFNSEILLSVRLMTFNHEEFIEQAMQSIDMQETNFFFEVIVGEDFSTDGTLEKIKKFEFTNSKIRVNILKREKGDDYHKMRLKKGRIYNFEDILNNCKGKYIALLDGDDYWTDPFKLQKQVDFLEEHPQYTFVAGGFKSFNESTGESSIILKDVDKTLDNTTKGFDITKERFLNQWVTKSLTLLFRKEALDFKIFKKYKYFRDVHLNYSLLCSGKGYYMKEVLGVYRIHAGGIFSEISEREKYISYLNTYGELYKKNKSDLFLKQKYNRLLNEAAKRKFYKGKQYRLYLELFLISKSRSHFKNLIKALITKA